MPLDLGNHSLGSPRLVRGILVKAVQDYANPLSAENPTARVLKQETSVHAHTHTHTQKTSRTKTKTHQRKLYLDALGPQTSEGRAALETSLEQQRSPRGPLPPTVQLQDPKQRPTSMTTTHTGTLQACTCAHAASCVRASQAFTRECLGHGGPFL